VRNHVSNMYEKLDIYDPRTGCSVRSFGGVGRNLDAEVPGRRAQGSSELGTTTINRLGSESYSPTQLWLFRVEASRWAVSIRST